MNSQFNHLVWKEYRAQRALWAALAAAAFAIALALTLTVDHDTRTLAGALAALTGVLSIAFATASAAVAFAAEEEDGTAVWLRQFPVRTATLVSAKLATIVTGTIALFLVTGVMACLLIALHGGLDRNTVRIPFEDNILFGIAAIVVTGISFIVIAVFWSLRCRKVFTALGWCGVSFFFYALLLNKSGNGSLSPVPLLITLVVTALTTLSARQWHLGLRQSKAGDGATPGLRKPGRVSRRGILTNYSWLNLLGRCSQLSTVLTRTAAMLLWRELRFAVPFVIAFFPAGLVVVSIRYLTVEFGFPLFAFLGVATVECGLRTFRHDQQQLHGLFWSHRGVSPALVWLVRNFVWLATLISLSVGLSVIEEICFSLWGSEEFPHNQVTTMCQLLISLSDPHRISGENPLAGALIAGAWGFGAFMMSQLCSCWIRRPILAAFAAVVSVSAFSFWLGFLVYVDIPLWLTVWPLSLILMLAGFLTRRQWMDRRSSWKITCRRVAWIAVPCLFVLPIQRQWRQQQIPVTVTAMTADSHYVSYGYSAENTQGPVPEAWEKFGMAAAGALLTSDDSTSTETLPSPQKQQRQRALDALDTILEADLRQNRLPPRFRVPWSRHFPAVEATRLLTSDALQEFENGNPEEAVRRATQAVRLNKYLSQEATTWIQWNMAIQTREFPLQALRKMAADDRLTEEQLQHAANELTDTGTSISNEFNVVTNRLVVYHQLLSRQGYLWDWYLKLQADERKGERLLWPVTLINSHSSERYRVLQLMQLISDWIPTNYNEASQVPDAADELRKKLNRWIATSIHFETDLAADPMLEGGLTGDSSTDGLFRDIYNSESVTRVVIALQQYRRRYGEFPASLSALKEFGVERDHRLQDVEKHVEFGYAPKGYGSPLPVVAASGDVVILSASQPVIWSHGFYSPDYRSRLVSEQTHIIQETEPGRIFFFSGTQMANGITTVFRRQLDSLKREDAEAERESGDVF